MELWVEKYRPQKLEDYKNSGGSLTKAASIIGVGSDNTGTAGEIRFTTAASGTLTERLRIDSSGKFSLGRTSQITVASNTSDSVFEQLTNSSWPLALHSAQANKRGLSIFYADTGAGNAGDPYILCQNQTSTKFQVISNGNVYTTGIVGAGTSSPLTDSQLTVSHADSPAVAFQRTGSGRFEAAIGMSGSSSLKFYTGADSSTISGLSVRIELSSSGNVLPGTDNAQDLGSTSLRWRNIYTADLQMSNEGSSNEIDGTWGSYTIQEGEEDLFLINRRSGKKFKFNLTEVS